MRTTAVFLASRMINVWSLFNLLIYDLFLRSCYQDIGYALIDEILKVSQLICFMLFIISVLSGIFKKNLIYIIS
jgi:hypothetical protein